MKDEPSQILHVKNPDQMVQVGQIFSEKILAPLSESGENRATISLYGPGQSGKSTFIKPFETYLLSDWRFYEDMKTSNGRIYLNQSYCVRCIDFGYFSYPLYCKIGAAGLFLKPHHFSRGRLLFDMDRFKKVLCGDTRPSYISHRFLENEVKPGVDVVEHAIWPHLLRTDIAFVFLDITQVKKSMAYFILFSAGMRGVCTKEGGHRLSLSFFHKKFLASLFRVVAQADKKGMEGRYVVPVLLSEDPQKSVLFQRFMKAVRKEGVCPVFSLS